MLRKRRWKKFSVGKRGEKSSGSHVVKKKDKTVEGDHVQQKRDGKMRNIKR
jgi:hypothetical protein